MTHPWATHQGLPAPRSNQTQRVIVCPEAPADTAGSMGSFVFSPSFSVITVFLGVGVYRAMGGNAITKQIP